MMWSKRLSLINRSQRDFPPQERTWWHSRIKGPNQTKSRSSHARSQRRSSRYARATCSSATKCSMPSSTSSAAQSHSHHSNLLANRLTKLSRISGRVSGRKSFPTTRRRASDLLLNGSTSRWLYSLRLKRRLRKKYLIPNPLKSEVISQRSWQTMKMAFLDNYATSLQ